MRLVSCTMPPLDALDDWPVPNAAAAVVGPSGVLASHGDTERPFALASVTKPLVARAAQVAIEEGAVELDSEAGPPGSTVRHLLAHASGLAMLNGRTLARPGARRITPTMASRCLPRPCSRRRDRVRPLSCRGGLEPLGMAATRFDGGAQAAGYGATSTVTDLAAFAGDLLTPATVSAEMHADAIAVQFPDSTAFCPATGCNDPTIGASALRSRIRNHRTGPARTIRRAASAISASRAR